MLTKQLRPSNNKAQWVHVNIQLTNCTAATGSGRQWDDTTYRGSFDIQRQWIINQSYGVNCDKWRLCQAPPLSRWRYCMLLLLWYGQLTMSEWQQQHHKAAKTIIVVLTILVTIIISGEIDRRKAGALVENWLRNSAPYCGQPTMRRTIGSKHWSLCLYSRIWHSSAWAVETRGWICMWLFCGVFGYLMWLWTWLCCPNKLFKCLYACTIVFGDEQIQDKITDWSAQCSWWRELASAPFFCCE